jgi:hypothetical protein
MAHLDLLKTVHLPVSADGRNIKNSFGVIIAEATEQVTAHALAQLINLGQAGAEDLNRVHQEAEAKKNKLFGRMLNSR